MDTIKEKVVFENLPLNRASRKLFDQQPANVQHLQKLVNQGDAQIVEVVENGNLVFQAVYGLEEEDCLIVYSIHKSDTTNAAETKAFPDVMQWFEKLAKFAEKESIIYHTERAGMVKQGIKNGFAIGEVIMKKPIF